MQPSTHQPAEPSTISSKDMKELLEVARRLPVFLVPCLAKPASRAVLSRCNVSFSTSASRQKRSRVGEGNPNRGVSPLRRQAPFKPLLVNVHVKREGLPQPVLDPARRSRIEIDPQHGLFGFFNEKRLLTPPKEEAAHGTTGRHIKSQY